MESVGFDEPEIELAVGDEMTLHANVRPLEVANRKVTWESSDEAVVSVDATGKLKALATGNAVITATSVQNPEVYGECRVHVKMSSDMVDIIPYQREVKLSWPGYNPDYRWLVSWRQKGGEDYASAPAQTETSLYIRGLQPDTEYEGSISSSDSEEATPVEFVFSTKPLTSKYAVIALDKKKVCRRGGRTAGRLEHRLRRLHNHLETERHDARRGRTRIRRTRHLRVACRGHVR